MKKSKMLLNYKFEKYHSLNLAFSEHWSKRNNEKKKIQSDIKYLLLNQIRLLDIKDDDKYNYYYKFYFEYNFKNENCDTDNFAFMRKAIMDEIKESNLIIDDSFKYCSIYDYNYSQTKENYICVYFTRHKKEVAHKPNLSRKIKAIDTSKWNYPNRKK